MAAELLDGKLVSGAVIERLKGEAAAFAVKPKLVFVRVGDDPASTYYVRSKGRMAERVGLRSDTIVLPETVAQSEVEALVARLNLDADVDGVLVQLPIPGLDERRILDLIDPDKDVDGLHPVNVGRLWSGRSGLFPATPLGVLALLDHYGVPLEGRRAVIVGRSNLVGKPMAALLLARHATVTLAHSRSRDLGAITREADVLVAAVGVAGLITPAMVKPGAAVLDVGMTRVDGAIRGDVDPAVADVAGHLTPMPGGTGPMTVAMVISNTIEAAKARRGL